MQRTRPASASPALDVVIVSTGLLAAAPATPWAVHGLTGTTQAVTASEQLYRFVR
ncbi:MULTISPECIES: hypothetical protein [Mycobacteriaceae]|uniref:Uncharacterized protein n=2 Tax=Mycobacteriaceae TaxID=1762 RepID=A0ABM9LZN9_9MYCO|nr:MULTISPECIES: hypothetical protein [unclassified Mycolicibacter]MEB3035186.1 hypothetical protein [Mycolicibacter sp. MYC340]CAJ1507541.1 hypothetical protein MU0102_003107 [Mycolicibacter sp. MU0102]